MNTLPIINSVTFKIDNVVELDNGTKFLRFGTADYYEIEPEGLRKVAAFTALKLELSYKEYRA